MDWQVAFIALQAVTVIVFGAGGWMFRTISKKYDEVDANLHKINERLEISEKRYVSHATLESREEEYRKLVKDFDHKMHTMEKDMIGIRGGLNQNGLVNANTNELVRDLAKKIDRVLDDPDYFNRCPYRREK